MKKPAIGIMPYGMLIRRLVFRASGSPLPALAVRKTTEKRVFALTWGMHRFGGMTIGYCGVLRAY